MACAAQAGEVRVTAEPAEPPCRSPFDCRADYDAFVVHAIHHAVPHSRAEIQAALDAVAADKSLARSQLDVSGDLTPPQLRGELLDGLNIRFLLDRQTPLLVRVLSEQQRRGHQELRLSFEDPWLGTFTGTLLRPFTPGPHPAVLGLPGHADHAAVFLENTFGDALADAGFVVLALDLRADAGDALEDALSWDLLERGFNLFGLHVVEALLARRFLLSRPEVSGVSLLGHSGGGMVAAVAAHLEPGWDAVATDFVSSFWEVADHSGHILCETQPALYPLHRQLQLMELPTPTRVFEYGFPEGEAEVLGWLQGRP